MQQITEHDAGAFEILYERYQGIISRHLEGIVRDEAAAQNLQQEVFLRVWTHADQWSGRGSFKAWLYRIATNLALNHLRTVRRRRELPLEVPVDWGDDEEHTVPAWMIDNTALGPEQAAELAERMERFRHLFARLPEDKREVLRLVHEMEMSIQDVADELGIPEGTVKSRLYYARKRLARDWQDIESI
jgi:RNA polymerase sigma-70 factor (ECF subfamily)